MDIFTQKTFTITLNELSEFASFIRRKLIPSFGATIKYRFLFFASCHSGDVKIVCCISQIDINISVSIFCEQIRKVARCKTSYCFIRHRSCFTFIHVGDSKPFKVLD